MQIDTLAGGTVRITLGQSDMYSYNISYNEIAGHSRQTRLALSRLIASIREREGLRLEGDRLLVEVFPSGEGGCLLYLSCLGHADNSADKKPGGKNRYILAESDSLNDIIALCHVLKINCGSVRSCLYHLDGCYRLVIPAFSKAEYIEAVSREYALVSLCGDNIKSETAEHYRLICNDAVDRMSALY